MIIELGVAILLAAATAPNPAAEISNAQLSSIPAWALEAFDRAGIETKYAFSAHVNPFYQRGDFDGDGKADLAVFVVERKSGKIGILIIRRATSKCEVVGAGNTLGAGGDDWSFVDAWSVYERGKVEQGVGEGPPPKIKGDALRVEQTESASALIWWNGRKYSWYQQGD